MNELTNLSVNKSVSRQLTFKAPEQVEDPFVTIWSADNSAAAMDDDFIALELKLNDDPELPPIKQKRAWLLDT